ncbi:MAG: hypothetical protein JST15_11160 [Bacteroidetes bacterium]|nr:hypothetical protein [Bacteroidota bacterium]
MKKKKLKKNLDVKAVSTDKTDESEDLLYFGVPGNRNMKDLKKELLRKSKEKDPFAIMLYLKNENNFSLDKIVEVGNFIKQNNIRTTVNGSEEVSFKELAFTIFCSSHLIYFDMGAVIDMGSHNLRSKKLQEIAKKMSDVIVCDENEIVKYCNRKRLIDPILIFEEEDSKYVRKYQNLIQYHFCGFYYKRRKK